MKRLALLIIAALMGMMLMNGVASAAPTDPDIAQTQTVRYPPKPEPVVTVDTVDLGKANCTTRTVKTKTTTVTVDFFLVGNAWLKGFPKVDVDFGTRPATDTECPPPVPTKPKDEVKVVVSDPLVQCDQGTALVRTFTTTTPYVLVDNKWVLGTPVQTYTDSVTNATLAQCPKPADIVTSVTSDPFVECDKGTVLVRTFITTTSFELNDKNVFVKGTPVETYTDVYTDATAQQCPPVVVDPPTDPDCTGIGFFDPEIGKCVATDPETPVVVDPPVVVPPVSTPVVDTPVVSTPPVATPAPVVAPAPVAAAPQAAPVQRVDKPLQAVVASSDQLAYTGMNRGVLFLLLAAGGALVIVGGYLITVGRKKDLTDRR
jgi:hypothetical protein